MPVYCAPCGGKILYRTRSDAADAVRSLRARGADQKREKRGRVMPYPCPDAAGFHVGHSRR